MICSDGGKSSCLRVGGARTCITGVGNGSYNAFRLTGLFEPRRVFPAGPTEFPLRFVLAMACSAAGDKHGERGTSLDGELSRIID